MQIAAETVRYSGNIRKGSANSIKSSNFRLRFGPLPPQSPEVARRHWMMRLAAASNKGSVEEANGKRSVKIIRKTIQPNEVAP